MYKDVITAQTYKARRLSLMEKIGPNAVAILPANQPIYRSADTTYAFRQSSDFFYLTGCHEPFAVLLLTDQQQYLFLREADPATEQWTGKMLGLAGAKENLGFDDSFPIDTFFTCLANFLENKQTLYYPFDASAAFIENVFLTLQNLRKKIRQGIRAPAVFSDLSMIIHEMRMKKSVDEVAEMQRAADITVAAHIAVMKQCQADMYEYELEAIFQYECARRGARSLAYTPIVGAGKNACVLHYVENTAKLKAGDLLLIDAGAEYAYYAADVTRTFPVSGRFSEPQKEIYQLVLSAQEAAIAKIAPGVPWGDLQCIIIRILTEGLLSLGLLTGAIEDLIAIQAVKRFYMHNSGHWLGLDTHDVGEYRLKNGDWRPLEAGFVLTVEPGLYIPDDESIPQPWRGIGIRIEDDILVTENGALVLTEKLPKSIAAIEALMST